MLEFANQPKLGYGIFTIADVASILGLPKEKTRRWLKEYWDLRLAPEGERRSSWGERKDKAVNFFVLVEFYMFYQLRRSGVSTSQILNSHRLLRARFDTPYPFASYRIMTDGRAILFSPDGGDSILDAKPSLQYNLKEIIEGFLKKIDFGTGSQIAQRLYPAGKDSSVVVDPEHQFGQPIIKGTNILAGSLYALYQSGEKVEFIASLYGLQSQEVVDAIDFYQKAA
jgi:uncharacterized protein (DUF433 family)